MVNTREKINVLFIGDIVGRPGRRAAAYFIAELKRERRIDLVIANGENLAAGTGMTQKTYDEMISAGVDYFTSGNHIWNKKEFIPCLDDTNIKVLRPANYPGNYSGRGAAVIKVKDAGIVLANLNGQVFMKDEEVSSPFAAADSIINQYQGEIIIIDFHAEATSEKWALANYLDGRAAAVLGTHTHVQTADERILPRGTAFLTDVGMCGPLDSVIGIKKEIIIAKFLTGQALSHKVAIGDSVFESCLVSVDRSKKKALGIERIRAIHKAE
ncbi:MAG: TIGR00282 family metallophosphoesterase [Patescibacteria group bacterium]